MDLTVRPGTLSGSIGAIPSKSEAHRTLICAAFAQGPTRVRCAASSADIDATASCLRSLGAGIRRRGDSFLVEPIARGAQGDPLARRGQTLDCGESGSTLRFLLPIVAALGCGASLTGHGRLASRPLSPLYEQLMEHGVSLSAQGAFPLEVSGSMTGGVFELPGNVSSQYVSGLVMAAAITNLGIEVRVQDPVQSRPYIDVTCRAVKRFGIGVECYPRHERDRTQTVWSVGPEQIPGSPGEVVVPGDWSNAAFWLCAGALGAGVCVTGLETGASCAQGDRTIMGILARMGARVVRGADSVTVSHDALEPCDLDMSDVPDLVPPVAVVAALADGTTRIRGAARLRLKESDRIQTVAAALSALGASVDVVPDGLDVHGRGSLQGGTVDAANDHRIAMMAAVAATRADGPVTIRGAECVAKSYPAFFDDLASLGGAATREVS